MGSETGVVRGGQGSEAAALQQLGSNPEWPVCVSAVVSRRSCSEAGRQLALWAEGCSTWNVSVLSSGGRWSGCAFLVIKEESGCAGNFRQGRSPHAVGAAGLGAALLPHLLPHIWALGPSGTAVLFEFTCRPHSQQLQKEGEGSPGPFWHL